MFLLFPLRTRLRDFPLARLRTELHSCRRMFRPSVVYAFPPVYVSHINLVNARPKYGITLTRFMCET